MVDVLGRPAPPSPPYLVVPVADSPIDTDLDIDQNTGEIKTKVVLDREIRDGYSLSAIPLNGDGENIKEIMKKMKTPQMLNIIS